MVALVVSAVLLLGARILLGELGDDAHRITDAATRADRDANAERVLRSLLARLEVGTDSTRTFGGDERVAHFTTWCDVPAGWQERCQAALALDTADGELALTAALSTGESLVLRRGFHAGAFRYLSDAAMGGTWFREWGTGLTAPIALGVILDRDTLIVRIGERG